MSINAIKSIKIEKWNFGIKSIIKILKYYVFSNVLVYNIYIKYWFIYILYILLLVILCSFLLHIFWFYLTMMILVSDFRNLAMVIKKAIKDDKKYINFWVQLIRSINKIEGMSAFNLVINRYISIIINYL